MAEGAIGKDPGGRQSLVAIAIAFVPAAIVGFIGSQFIEDHLLEVGPVVAAWIVGRVRDLRLRQAVLERHPRAPRSTPSPCGRP